MALTVILNSWYDQLKVCYFSLLAIALITLLKYAYPLSIDYNISRSHFICQLALNFEAIVNMEDNFKK